MRKYLVIGSLLLLAVTVLVGGLVMRAEATPTWDTGFCGPCHNGGSGGVAPPAHTVAAHAGFASSCSTCHTTVPDININACGACHGGITVIVQKPGHAGQGCTDSDCHEVAGTTTTTAAGTTTTQAGTTTTTAAGTTTTTVPTRQPTLTG